MKSNSGVLMFGYKKLIVWQKSIELVEKVYALIQTLPGEEKYALADQLRRSVISVSSNIAEGAGRATNKDYAHFLAIARVSLYEVLAQLDVAERIGYFTVGKDIEDLASEIARMLGSMLKKYGALPYSTSTQNKPPLIDFNRVS